MRYEKYYKVVELTATDEIQTFERSKFKTKKEAESFIENFDDDFYQLTILEVWE